MADSDASATDDHDHPGHDHGDHDHDAVPCTEALEELYLYLDGELTETKRTVIQGHLDDCNPCFEAFDFEAELRMVIKRRCTDQVPDSLRERIAEQLRASDE
jgi:mycothiol system anti-sigma-R factor